MLILGLLVLGLLVSVAFVLNEVQKGKSFGGEHTPVKNEETKFPYQKKHYFMTEAERNFFDVLTLVLNDMYYIFPQVNLDKFIYVDADTNNRFSDYHRMNQYSVDYLICSKPSKTPLLAIELNDASHTFTKREERDEKVGRMLRDAEIPLLVINNERNYIPSVVKGKIDEALSITNK